jgi:hypothetical protein
MGHITPRSTSTSSPVRADISPFSALKLIINSVEVFFRCDPCGSRIIHRPTFMASLQLHPKHPQFPHSALLHAIVSAVVPPCLYGLTWHSVPRLLDGLLLMPSLLQMGHGETHLQSIMLARHVNTSTRRLLRESTSCPQSKRASSYLGTFTLTDAGSR